MAAPLACDLFVILQTATINLLELQVQYPRLNFRKIALPQFQKLPLTANAIID
jgi:hypothetical protein